MKKLLAQVRWPVQSLTAFLVSTGPGSFTGIGSDWPQRARSDSPQDCCCRGVISSNIAFGFAQAGSLCISLMTPFERCFAACT